MIGYVFETKCLENNKSFIGKRLSVSFDARYLGDNEELRKDIAIYGHDKFVCRMLMPYETEKALNAAEKWYIENSTAELYNISTDKAVKDDVVISNKPKKSRRKKQSDESLS